MSDNDESRLINSSLLANLTKSERAEALKAAIELEKRAEERAEKRALEQALQRKKRDREREIELEHQRKGACLLNGSLTRDNSKKIEGAASDDTRIQFVPKKLRAKMKELASRKTVNSNSDHVSTLSSKRNEPITISQKQKSHNLSTSELNAIKKAYLGESALQDEATMRRQELQKRRARAKKKITFKFEWDNSEDTSAIDDQQNTMRLRDKSSDSKNRRRNSRRYQVTSNSNDGIQSDVTTKPLEKMTSRDWRIYRENYDIIVKGGKAPPPLRNFRESNPPIHSTLINAIEMVLKYKKPSSIQRQAIPIGLQLRDLIGIAETGSGKTAAFGIPLCHHILNLPSSAHTSVADNGPFALVMAPTRELALQINSEFSKILSQQTEICTSCVVGGQEIQKQAFILRKGVHVVVGTPGRINDCIEMRYLVLNQCYYIVLDEADRMIDLGFAPQIEQVLDAMGGLLKSENEREAYEQELDNLKHLSVQIPKYRLTAMFSATMPPEVQRIAKKYLRHPAMVTVGDKDSGKNQRIEQRVIFLSSPSMKEKALKNLLFNQIRIEEKTIVFVNEKRNADIVGRMVERIPRRCVVLHGAKSQKQREENLEAFRRGGVVLVATDVAGRGLDIANVKHVINYDIPTRSIDNYCHRIGRTGRAGNQGFATSFLTDEDEGIMLALKDYLVSTGSPVPDRLLKHPAAASSTSSGIFY